MFIFDTIIKSNEWIIPLICVAALVVVFIIFLLLYKFVIVKKKLSKSIHNITKRFEYLHALLVGQDSKYVSRLEIISNSNVLYASTYAENKNRYQHIRDHLDSHAQKTINDLIDLLDEKKYRALKEALANAKEEIATFEKAVNEFNNDLLKIIKPEEDCRQSAMALKEMLRRLRNDYLSKKGDLVLVERSFEAIFNMFDTQFDDFEDLVQSAHYEDANLLLPQIERALKEVDNALTLLPNMCAKVVTVVPDRIIELENAYESLIRLDYPLHHLIVNATIKEIREQLEIMVQRMKKFDLVNIDAEIDDIMTRIDEFFASFDEEKASRKQFEEKNDGVYRLVTTIEKRFIKLCNIIPEIAKIYVINEEHQAKINEIQNEINKLGALKRSLDTFIHSSTKQPYSLLVNKMNELDNANTLIISEMDEFDRYLDSLKADAESAYSLIREYYYKLKVAEKTIRDINVDSIAKKYEDRINQFYELIDIVNIIISEIPINIDRINDNVTEMRKLGNELLDEGEIKQDRNMMILAENAILYANKDRKHFSDIQTQILQAENEFQNGDFEKAYITAGDALKNANTLNREN